MPTVHSDYKRQCSFYSNLQATQVLPGEQQEKKKGGKGKGRAASSGKVSPAIQEKRESFLSGLATSFPQPHSPLSTPSLPPPIPPVHHRRQ